MTQSIETALSFHENPTEYFDLSDYCRLCLQMPEESQLLDLQVTYDEEEHLSYYDCFTICTKIDLRAGGVYAPHQLCKACGLELQVAYDFHKKVEESKRFLVQLNKSQNAYDDALMKTAIQIGQVKEPVEVVDELEIKATNTQLLASLHVENEQIESETISGQEDTVNNYETSIEYEELEDNIEMVEYQSVDEVVDEDAETVQIKVDDQEYVIQKLSLSGNHKSDALPDPEQTRRHVSRTKLSESIIKSEAPCEDLNMNNNCDNIGTFKYESTESESELTINTQNVENITETNSQTRSKSDGVDEIDVKTVVISRKGEVMPRRRYSGKFKCDYCQKVFKNRSRMLIHRRSHEPNRPKFECEECGRLYATKQAKEVHVRTFHNGIGLKCPICGKIYDVRKLLDVHMRYHTGDFPYVCDLCGQKFAQMCHLNTHKNVKHNSVRYSCAHPGCGKFFTSSGSLRSHEFSHSAMPFECSYCKRGYPAKAKLKVHIRQKHGVEVSLEQMEEMRKFHVMRSKLKLVKISE